MNGLYHLLHLALIALYAVAPAATLAGAVWLDRRAGRKGHKALRGAAATLVGGAGIGAALAVTYAQLVAGSPWAASAQQVLVTAWFGMGLLALLKGLDWAVRATTAGVRKRRGWRGRSSASAGLFVRLLMLVAVALPVLMAAVMTFRPKVVPRDDPTNALRRAFDAVAFEASDGTRISGWWVPTGPTPAGRSVLLVHGLGGGKADVLTMAEPLLNAGYNVLLIDLRAHGRSGGQFSSFGDLERHDVEAAAAWAKANRPAATRQLVALGASMGAAAVLAARDEAGKSPFDAVAVLGCYDDLGGLARSIVGRQFVWPLSQVAEWVALPAASIHAGTDLARFRPAAFAADLWPTPLLVVHGTRDATIPFASGQRLYRAASDPKRSWWVEGQGHNEILSDETVMSVVIGFFQDARRLPKEGVI